MASFAGSPARFREIEKQVYLKLDTDPRDMSSGDGNRKKNQSQAKEEFQRFCQRKNLRPKFINVPGYGKNTVKVTLRVQDGDKEMMIKSGYRDKLHEAEAEACQRWFDKHGKNYDSDRDIFEDSSEDYADEVWNSGGDGYTRSSSDSDVQILSPTHRKDSNPSPDHDYNFDEIHLDTNRTSSRGKISHSSILDEYVSTPVLRTESTSSGNLNRENSREKKKKKGVFEKVNEDEDEEEEEASSRFSFQVQGSSSQKTLKEVWAPGNKEIKSKASIKRGGSLRKESERGDDSVSGTGMKRKLSECGEEEEARKTSQDERREESPMKFTFDESDKSSFKLRQETSTKREKKSCQANKDKKSSTSSSQQAASKPGPSKISDIFQVDDDPFVIQMQERERRESRENPGGRNRRRNDESRRKSSVGLLMKLNNIKEDDDLKKEKKPRNPKKSSRKSGEQKIDKFVTKKKIPTVDEILRLPEDENDNSKSVNELLDEIDEDISRLNQAQEENRRRHEENLFIRKKQLKEKEIRTAKCLSMREELVQGITEPLLKKYFYKNLDYLRSIHRGEVYSARHEAYHKNQRTRQALLYTMITHPFSDDQVEWTFKLFKEEWMRSTKEKVQFNEYIWKVLMSECFVKFYMDFFKIGKEEAEEWIKDTPLDDEEDSDTKDSSSDEED